jgi:hypothetical protein
MRRLALLLSFAAVGLVAPGAAHAQNGIATLTVTATGLGGSIDVSTSQPMTGMSCSRIRCWYRMPVGTRVTLTAVASPVGRVQPHLARWLGACNGAGLRCGLTMTGNVSTTARFTPVQLTAFSSLSRGGTVGVNPMGVSCGFGCWLYDYAAPVTISASPAGGYAFGGWSGLCGGQGPVCTIQMFGGGNTVADMSCTGDVCSTEQPLSRTVTVTLAVSGRGTVKWIASGPSGKPKVGACPGTCTFDALRGTPVGLRPSRSAPGFQGWSGSLCRGAGGCTFSAFKDPSNKGPRIGARFVS